MEWYFYLLIIIASIIVLLALSIVLYRPIFKRLYDILLSGLAIIILSPFFIIFTPINAIAMKGNPFFVQRRPGKLRKDGTCKIFRLIKYRSMNNKKDENGNLLPDEVRLTKYGKILRATSLDELPELFNIFIGDMSIIGPRPQLVKDMVFFSDEVMQRQSIRPGLSGLAQVSGRNNISWDDKFKYDLEYLHKYSFLFDIKIIFMTVFKVLKHSDITEGDMATAMDYGDYLLTNNMIDKTYYDEKIKASKDIK